MPRKKKIRQKKQSLTKNVALLFLSIGILAGACVLFSTISGRPDYTYDPFDDKPGKKIEKTADKSQGSEEQKLEPKKGSTGSTGYAFWEILLLQDKAQASPDSSFSIRIASFRSLESAEKYAADLESKTHLKCSVEEQGKAFIVRWGNFHTREIAERYCSTLSGRLQKTCIVIRL